MGDFKRDPRTNPLAGDVVQGVYAKKWLHVSTPLRIRCRAVVGELVAFTTDDPNERGIQWCLLSEWCQPCTWISSYEVVEMAGG